MTKILGNLRVLLLRNEKKAFFHFVIFSVLISAVETVGISLIMPLISMAIDPDSVNSNQYYKYIYDLFEFKSTRDFIISFGIFLVFFYIFRSVINLYYYYRLNNFSQERYYSIVSRLFKKYMAISYRDFVMQNSSNLNKTIVTEAANYSSIIKNSLIMTSEVFVFIFIYSVMLYVDFEVTIVLTVILILIAVLLIKVVSSRIKQAGSIRENEQLNYYEVINKSFGNFKLIKLLCNDESAGSGAFQRHALRYAQATSRAQTLIQVPRFALEAVGFGTITIIVTYSVWLDNQNILSTLPMISMFALALYRLLPSINRIMTGYNVIVFTHKALGIIYSHLYEQTSEKLGKSDIEFNENIDFLNVWFEYEENKPVLCDISFSIKKGEKIAIVGGSGNGKSTLAGLIMGIYQPSKGVIRVDSQPLDDRSMQSWRKKIGYIPQSIYLFDGSVADNVVFDRDHDIERIVNALKQANIYDFLKDKDGIDTQVGEGGVMLSGGQKQRIAIARALYGDPEILIFDEGTSALDDVTEKKVMKEVYRVSHNKTLIVIAHRMSTISECRRIFHIDNGSIILEEH
jgi:ATP-binding cassette, subfamily B, bacterial PglK